MVRADAAVGGLVFSQIIQQHLLFLFLASLYVIILSCLAPYLVYLWSSFFSRRLLFRHYAYFSLDVRSFSLATFPFGAGGRLLRNSCS